MAGDSTKAKKLSSYSEEDKVKNLQEQKLFYSSFLATSGI